MGVYQLEFEMRLPIISLLFTCAFHFSFAVAADISGTVIGKSGELADAVIYIEKIAGKSFSPPGDEVVLDQKGLRFIPHVLPVIVGTEVSFANSDNILHHVFSPGPVKGFNLGTFLHSQSKKVIFDKPGIVTVLCNLHHEMSAVIFVVETPYFAVSDKKGRYRIKNVPDGKYKLSAWHEKMSRKMKEIEVTGGNDIIVNFSLENQ